MAGVNSISFTTLVLLTFVTLSSCVNINYVTPHPNSSCPARPCLTLSQYVQQAEHYFTSNTMFVFLDGEHKLSAHLALRGISNVTLMGNTSSFPQVISEIKCTRPVNIKLNAVSEIKITALAFASCGMNTTNDGAIHLSKAQNISFSGCIFHDNAFTALSTNHSSFTLSKVTFANNSQSALRVYSSTANSIQDSTFIKNSGDQGGAAAIFSSLMNFTGITVFASNLARDGGSLYLQDTNASFTGVNLFRDSHASGRRYLSEIGVRYIPSGGGVLYATSAHLVFEGETNFNNSSSDKDGGGIYATSDTTINFNGNFGFINNSAGFGGGISARSDTTMKFDGNYSFINNSASQYGGGIFALADATLNFNGNYRFVNNSAMNDGGGIAAETTMNFNGNYSFVNNFAGNTGGAISTGFDDTIKLDGRCSFINNSATYSGGAIMSGRSTINLYGDCSFTNNSATYGGGIALTASVYNLFQEQGSRISFTGNYAQRGGAINVFDSPYELIPYCYNTQVNFIPRTCFFQIKLPRMTYLTNNSDVNVSVIFEANSAQEAGDIIYGGSVDACLPVLNRTAVVNGLRIINQLAPGLSEDKLSAISSDPIKVCICNTSTGHPDCDGNINVTTYPGKTFTVSAVAVGQRNGTVPTVINSIFDKGSSASLNSGEKFQNSNKTCTPLHYTVFSNDSIEHMSLYVEGLCGPGLGQPLPIPVNLQPCPDGFELSPITRACICEKRLQTYTNSCDINRQTISRDRHSEFWVGYDNATEDLILHPHCPFDYCKSEPVDFTLNNTDLQCNYNRSGLLCGNCQPGLSLALGTSQCLECSDTYLILLVGFVLAGLFLVILLLICRLTVAVGTISGLIFYANIVVVNQSVFFPHNLNLYGRFLSVFISWLNLDLGIETCFYNGMDAYAKTWLQFVFPVYIWVLVGLLTISSYYSTIVARFLHGTNPVAVLATLFLLSYTKILRTIIAALSFTNLQYSNDTQRVWLYAGNITYLSGKHIPLFLAALAVFWVLFMPYTLLLLTGQFLQANSNHRMVAWVYSHRLKPFMDAYHGPYKDKHRYWPGLLLAVRFLLLLIFSSNVLHDPSMNLLAISICIIGLLTLQLSIRGIYKKWYLETLEAIFFLNLGILTVATYHVRATGGSQAAVTCTSVTAAFVVFIGIITYHVYFQLIDTRIWKRMQATIKSRCGPQNDNEKEAPPQTDTVRVINEEARAAVPMTVVTIRNREPLIFDREMSN